jgi:hypothetical protein
LHYAPGAEWQDMLQILGSPRTKFEAIGFNCGLSALVFALLLAMVSPASFAIRPSHSPNLSRSVSAPAWVNDTGTIRPASEAPAGPPSHRATIDRFGWFSFIPRSEPSHPNDALTRAADVRPAIRGGALKPWPVTPGTAPLMALVAYSPHAPPA